MVPPLAVLCKLNHVNINFKVLILGTMGLFILLMSDFILHVLEAL